MNPIPSLAFVAFLVCTAAGSTAHAQDTLLERILGQHPTGFFGYSVAHVGDADGDGSGDFAVGAFREPNGPVSTAGRVYLFDGATGALRWTASTDNNDFLGYSVAGIGDVNGDGYGDVLVGATQQQISPAGYARVYSGMDGSVLYTFTGASRQYGFSTAGLGDLDGDGVPDMAIGEPFGIWNGNSGIGRVEVRSGATGQQIWARWGWSAGENLGWSIAGIEDLTGNGVRDVLVGVPGARPNGLNYGGRVVLLSGVDGVLLNYVDGSTAGSRFGYSLVVMGDVDGDGVPDFAVGAPALVEVGTVHVISGATMQEIYRVSGQHEYGDFGASLATIEDIDGDGVRDLIIGAPREHGGEQRSGIVYLVSGADGTILHQFEGIALNGNLGISVASGGPFDLGGWPVAVLGAYGDPTNGTQAGALEFHSTYVCTTPQVHCVAHANSVGAGARIGWEGLPSVAWNQFDVTVSGGIPGEFALCFYGPQPTQDPFGIGFLCVAPAGVGLFRLGPPMALDGAGSGAQRVDTSVEPAGSGAGRIFPGSTWSFQYWYRDPAFPGGGGFNLSDGLEVVFCP